MLELYQMPLSHYCEKVRWALDYKSIPWRKRNLLPGLHVKTAQRLTGQTSVPILVHERRALNDSSRIIDYLDQRYPDRPLTPADPQLRRETLEWERFADLEIGDHVRRICYHTLLAEPNLVIPLLTQGGPWYGRLLLRRIYPRLERRMRQYMRIDAESTAASCTALARAIGQVEVQRAGRRHLVGDHFTRADLAVAALLAPLAAVRGYGIEWPAEQPHALAAEAAKHVEVIAWIRATYGSYRG
jgi:glutathione S-transferase